MVIVLLKSLEKSLHKRCQKVCISCILWDAKKSDLIAQIILVVAVCGLVNCPVSRVIDINQRGKCHSSYFDLGLYLAQANKLRNNNDPLYYDVYLRKQKRLRSSGRSIPTAAFAQQSRHCLSTRYTEQFSSSGDAAARAAIVCMVDVALK